MPSVETPNPRAAPRIRVRRAVAECDAEPQQQRGDHRRGAQAHDDDEIAAVRNDGNRALLDRSPRPLRREPQDRTGRQFQATGTCGEPIRSLREDPSISMKDYRRWCVKFTPRGGDFDMGSAGEVAEGPLGPPTSLMGIRDLT